MEIDSPQPVPGIIKVEHAQKLRYLRFRSDKSGNGNIAEIEFNGNR